MCVCLFSRVIKHSLVLKQRNVRGKKEVVLSGGGIFLFFFFLSLGTALSQHRRDLPFFLDKNLSQILLRIIKVYSFSLLLSNQSCDKDECNNTFFVFVFERCYCYRWWWWFSLLA